MAEVKLGDKVKDKITELEGIAIGMTTWINGCVRVVIQPQKLHEGRSVDPTSVDVQQVDVIQEGAIKMNESANIPGGPMPEPRQY